MKRQHYITVIGRTIEHTIYPLDTKPMHKPPEAPIRIYHSQEDRKERIASCLEALKKELEGEL